jgi:hypothetical protein
MVLGGYEPAIINGQRTGNVPQVHIIEILPLFFCVRLISFSMSWIFSKIPILAGKE